jgi:hypothetical protein
MILPDEERDWIEKYRQAVDVKAVEEPRLHRIRRAWSRIASAVSAARSCDGSARDSNESQRDRLVIQTNSAEPAGLLNKSSAFEPEQISEVSSSADDEAEYAC